MAAPRTVESLHADRFLFALGSVSMPDPNDAEAWEAYVDRTRVAAGERVRTEVARLRSANILDGDGRVIPEATPADMVPTARTSTITG